MDIENTFGGQRGQVFNDVLSDIFVQDEVTTCGVSSVINALRLLNKSPMPIPGFHAHIRSLRERARVSSDVTGASSEEINYLLSVSGVLCGLVNIIPKYWAKPEALLQRFLDQGCPLILTYT